MKNVCLISLATFLGISALTAAPQLEFVARIQTIQEAPDATLVIVRLTPEFSTVVRVSSTTEIKDENDLPIPITTLIPDTLVKIEGLFVEGGILALEVEVTDTPDEFEIRGVIQAIEPIGPDVRVQVVGFWILVPETAQIQDALGNKLFRTELDVDQVVKIEGMAQGPELVARQVKALSAEDGFALINISGIVTEIENSKFFVDIGGGALALVEVKPETEIEGNLAVGVALKVVGRLTPALTIGAQRILVERPFRLLPDELHLVPGETGRVDVVLREAVSEDVTLLLSSRNPAVAAPSGSQIVIPSGQLSAFFEVTAGSGEGRTDIDVISPSLAGFRLALDVEVESRQNGPDNSGPGDEAELEIKWNPDEIQNAQPGLYPVQLTLNQPAPADLTVTLFVKDGDPTLVRFPPEVAFPEGETTQSVTIEVVATGAEVKVRAALPFGGDNDDLEIDTRPAQLEDVNIEWQPDDVEAAPSVTVVVQLQLDRPAPIDFEVVVSVKDGNASLVAGVPPEVRFSAGESSATIPLQMGTDQGRVEFRAAVPFQLGGDTDDLRIEIR